MFKRITKHQAYKRWCEKKPIWLCPSKMNPSFPFSSACMVQLNDEYIDYAIRYKNYYDERESSSYARQYAHLWHGTIEKTAWELMYNDWKYYNTNYEMGYYAHYYIQIERGQ